MLLMNFNSQNKTENKNPHPVSLLHAVTLDADFYFLFYFGY